MFSKLSRFDNLHIWKILIKFGCGQWEIHTYVSRIEIEVFFYKKVSIVITHNSKTNSRNRWISTFGIQYVAKNIEGRLNICA
jgi:hypothetical protein